MADEFIDHEFLSPEEVDARFNLTRGTAKRWAKAGTVASIELPGGLIRFRRLDIEALRRPKFEPQNRMASESVIRTRG